MNIGLILLAIVVVLVMLAIAVVGMYNSLVKLNIKTDEAGAISPYSSSDGRI